MKWPPRNEVKGTARVKRGIYTCAGWEREAHEIPASIVTDKGRENNVFVDHIEPVVCPTRGWKSYDSFVNRLYVEHSGLQVLCKECHDAKTAAERKTRNESKAASS